MAVKVIEHRAGNSSKGVSAGREELLATTSHPNVVGTVWFMVPLPLAGFSKLTRTSCGDLPHANSKVWMS